VRKEDSPTTKLKILEAAKKLFAEKGFDGARVDDIAENAGVNKALIYYYFKSKRDILEELVNGLIEELVKLSYGVIEDGVLDLESKGSIQREMETFFKFLDDRKDVIKIMMMESLKESEEKPFLFRFSEIAISEEGEKMKELFANLGYSLDDIDVDEAIVADFFTGMVPMISFIVYRDKWSKYFNIDPDDLREKFFSVFQITHLAYHKTQLEKMK
jgi:AcrR family transcriptional regulator